MVQRLSADDGIVAAAGMCATRLSVIAARIEANGPAGRPPPGHGRSCRPLGRGELPPISLGTVLSKGTEQMRMSKTKQSKVGLLADGPCMGVRKSS